MLHCTVVLNPAPAILMIRRPFTKIARIGGFCIIQCQHRQVAFTLGEQDIDPSVAGALLLDLAELQWPYFAGTRDMGPSAGL